MLCQQKETNRLISHIAANKIFGWCSTQFSPYAEYKFTKTVEMEKVSETPDYSDIGSALEVNSGNVKFVTYCKICMV